MLRLPNYSDECLEVKIMKLVAHMPQTDYLITTKFLQMDEALPKQLISTLERRIASKRPEAFKFIYTEGNWRLLLTCIPLHKPIEKAYSLVNDFVKLCKDS